MADGVWTTTKTMWGYACSVSAGTATTSTTVLPADTKVHLSGILVTTAATTDIMYVKDGKDNVLVMTTGGTLYTTPKHIPFDAEVEGLKVGFNGATSTGLISIYLS